MNFSTDTEEKFYEDDLDKKILKHNRKQTYFFIIKLRNKNSFQLLQRIKLRGKRSGKLPSPYQKYLSPISTNTIASHNFYKQKKAKIKIKN